MNPNIVSTIILVLHWLVVIGLAIRVIMRRPPVGVSLAWLTVIFSVPMGGAAVYLLFGEKRLGRRRAARIDAGVIDVAHWQKALKKRYDRTATGFDPSAQALIIQAERVLGFAASPGNDMELLGDFRSFRNRLIADIDAAQVSIHLCFYIWDATGGTADVMDALIRAVRRGVTCRALADAIGSKPFLSSAAAGRLRKAGVKLVAALPTGALPTILARSDLRNHRKIVVIDDVTAYAGSHNLVDPGFFKQEAGVGEWVDAMVRVTGPAAAALDSVFRLDWSVETQRPFKPPPIDATGEAGGTGGATIQVVPSGPDPEPEAIHRLLLTAIYAARRDLMMTTPYFIPDESVLTALVTAALRGVAVTLIVPARNDSLLVRYGSVAHFDDLMSAGVRIALFNGGLLHTKSLTIDGATSVFGSVNLDMRSLWLNFEISLLVYDRDFTGRLRALQDSYLTVSDELDLESWRRRSAARRFAENACRLLSPLL